MSPTKLSVFLAACVCGPGATGMQMLVLEGGFALEPGKQVALVLESVQGGCAAGRSSESFPEAAFYEQDQGRATWRTSSYLLVFKTLMR